MPREPIAAVVERLRAEDPDLVLAADEVDRDLLRWFAELTPAERLDRAARVGADLERMRDAHRAR